jgi:hypothetical protein
LASLVFQEISDKVFRELLSRKFVNEIGFSIGTPFHLVVTHNDPRLNVNNTTIEKETLAKILSMTYGEEFEWTRDHNVDTLTRSTGMTLEDAYTTSGVLPFMGHEYYVTMTLCCYVKKSVRKDPTLKPKMYREYFLRIIFEDGMIILIGCAGKLWKIASSFQFRRKLKGTPMAMIGVD